MENDLFFKQFNIPIDYDALKKNSVYKAESRNTERGIIQLIEQLDPDTKQRIVEKTHQMLENR
jgi:hypothetical protein